MLVNLLDWGRLMLLDQVAGITFWLQVLWVIALVTCGAVLFRLSGVRTVEAGVCPRKNCHRPSLDPVFPASGSVAGGRVLLVPFGNGTVNPKQIIKETPLCFVHRGILLSEIWL